MDKGGDRMERSRRVLCSCETVWDLDHTPRKHVGRTSSRYYKAVRRLLLLFDSFLGFGEGWRNMDERLDPNEDNRYRTSTPVQVYLSHGPELHKTQTWIRSEKVVDTFYRRCKKCYEHDL